MQEFHKRGSHRLVTAYGRISLSKSGFVQSAFTAKTPTHFEECIQRLDDYYDEHGEDFLADVSFVNHIEGI